MVAAHQSPRLLRAVALSGGPDSLCAAALMPPGLALIVDHGLRPDSRAEAQWAADQARNLGHRAEILTWSHNTPPTTQAAYRAGRYALLARACQRHGVGQLWMGHQADDQGETVLLRLAKGSGLLGLSGMAHKSWIGNTRLVRPLLTTPKAQILDWLRARALDFVGDPSNQNTAYLRVQWRQYLDQNPGVRAKVLGLSQQVSGLRNASLTELKAIEVEVLEPGVLWLPDAIGGLSVAALHEILSGCARWVGGAAIPRVGALVDFVRANPTTAQQASAARALLWRRKDGYMMLPENRTWSGPQQANPQDRAHGKLRDRRDATQDGLWFPGDQARIGGLIVGDRPRFDHEFATKSISSPLGN